MNREKLRKDVAHNFQSCTFNRSVTSPVEPLSCQSLTVNEKLTQCELIFYKITRGDADNFTLNIFHEGFFLYALFKLFTFFQGSALASRANPKLRFELLFCKAVW